MTTPTTAEDALGFAADVYRLARDYDTATVLLDEIVATFRLPANRVLIAKQLPELERVMDNFIVRYAKHFEGK